MVERSKVYHMQGHARSQVPMGLSRRASMAYGRAASGTHLSTQEDGGDGGRDSLSVEKGEASDKLAGSRNRIPLV